MKKRLIPIGALFLTLALSGTALAIDLDTAKARGLVGETPSGYLEAVGSASGEVRALVDDINGKRRDTYRRIAGKRGTTLPVVEQLAGKKAIEKTPPGQFVKTPGGQWVKK